MENEIKDTLMQKAEIFSTDIVGYLKANPFIAENWRWALAFGILAAGFVVRPIVEVILSFFVNRVLQRVKNRFLFFFSQLQYMRPLSWVIVGFLWLELLHLLDLSGKMEAFLDRAVWLMLSFYLIRISYIAVEAVGKILEETVKKTESKVDDQLVPLATKSLKFVVVCLGILMMLQGLGLNVGSLLAGLGIGSAAIALAAKDAITPFFGSATILIDRPFEAGDHVKFSDVEGQVEEVGFRSTRIRSLYNSVITVPNSIMAVEKIDNLGIRPARRCRHVVQLDYKTSPEKVTEFCERVRYAILQDEKVLRNSVVVKFNGFGEGSLLVLVVFHLEVKDSTEELSRQEKILLEILAAARNLGVEFASNQAQPTKV